MLHFPDLFLPFLAAVFGAAILALLAISLRFDRRKSLFKLLPGPYRYPILGTALEVAVSNEEYNALTFRLRENYGERCILYTFGLYFILLSNADDIQKLLSSTVHVNKGRTYRWFTPWLGEGLLTSGDKKWRIRRKMLTPSFHFRILEDFLVIFNEQSQVLVDILRQDFSDGKEKDICQYMTRCTLDIIGETTMGTKLGSQYAGETDYFKAVQTACEIQIRRVVMPYLWPDFIFNLTPSGREYTAALKTLHDFTDKIIKERKLLQAKEKVNGELKEIIGELHRKGRLAFLDLLLEAQRDPEYALSDLDIREEVDTFMFEGHDTTSSSLNWTIFLLGCYPQYQTLVHEELDKIFGEDKTGPITSKDLAEMKYLEACTKEALRLYPSVPFMSRLLTSDLALDEKTTIPAGYEVMLCTRPIHQSEKHFPNPKDFLPDRFLPDYEPKRHPFAYIPFSAGPRNCIGQKFAMMEQKVVLANVLRNFKVEAAEGLEDVVVMVDMITRPRDGLKIRLFPRS